MLRTRLIAGPRAGLIMSAVTATLLTIISVGETFFEPLRVRPDQPAPVTLRLPPVAMRAMFSHGTPDLVRAAPVISRGTTASDASIAESVTLYESARRPVRLGTLVAVWFVYFLIAMMMAADLRR